MTVIDAPAPARPVLAVTALQLTEPLPGFHPSQARACGWRVSKANRPPARSAVRTAASELRNSSSVSRNWNAWPVITARSNSDF